NRDFYGSVRFDDVAFQLSPEGQALQGKFIESYAEQLRDGIEDRLVLAPGQPVDRPGISDASTVRGRAAIGSGNAGSAVPVVNPGEIHDEAARVRSAGHQLIGNSRDQLDAITRDARGATPEAADEVKKW